MTGGILQLVAKGTDDMYIINKPQITYFKCVYRRYSNFSITQERLAINGDLQFGKSSTVKIKRLADLINKMYLVLELPEIEVEYDKFTYSKLEDICTSVGISLPLLYQSYMLMFFLIEGAKYNKSDIVDKIFYDDIINIVMDYRITLYRDIISLMEQLISDLQAQEKTYNQTQLNKYLNPAISVIPPLESSFKKLPYTYKLYNDIILNLSLTNDFYDPAYTVYNYIYELYNNVANDVYIITNTEKVIDCIYNNIQKLKYSLNDNFITLILGYQPLYIIESYVYPRVIQSTYIGENLNTIDAFKNIKITTSINTNTKLLTSFKNNISYYDNLDIYLTVALYLNNTAEAYNESYYDANSVKNTIISIINNTLNTNLNQFIKILDVLNYFKFSSRQNININRTKILHYGMFYQMNQQGLIYILKNDTDKNIFFYDNNYSNLKPGDFYPNWLKQNVNIFFNNISNSFIGLDEANAYNFIQYYNDAAFMDFLNMNPLDNNNDHLSVIFKTNNIINPLASQVTNSISFSIINMNYTILDNRIKYLDFIPFNVVVHVKKLFSHTGSNSYFNNSLIVWTTDRMNTQTVAYLNFLNIYTGLVSDTLKKTANYIYDNTVNIPTATNLITHILTPPKTYDKTTFLLNIVNIIPDIAPYMDYLGYLYVSPYYINTVTQNNIPKYLFQLDAVIILMACDIIYDLIKAQNNITDVNFPLNELIKSVIKMLKLYLLINNDFPAYATPLDTSLYNHIITPVISAYIGKTPYDIQNDNINNFNYIHRLSSILNIILRYEMSLFDNLFQTKILSTNYNREYTTIYDNLNNPVEILSQSATIGIGKTMQQAYELFISYFINNRLGINTAQTTPVEPILNNLSYYNIDLLDTIYIVASQTHITNEIYNKISVIKNNIAQYSVFDNFKNIININNASHYYDTLFNILSFGLNNLNFQYQNINNIQTVTITNVAYSSPVIAPTDGLVCILYKTYITEHNLLSVIMGNVYNELQCVPLETGVILQCGYTYTDFADDIKRFNDSITHYSYNGVFDILIHIEQLLRRNNLSTFPVQYYRNILNINFKIYIHSELTTFPYNISTNGNNIDANTLKSISPTNLIGELYTLQQRQDAFNSTNLLGGLYTLEQRQDVFNFTNADIVNKYNSFSTIQDILKFILDTIIKTLIGTTEVFFLFNDTNTITNLNSLNLYYTEKIKLYNSYLDLLTENSSSTTFNNSHIYNRLIILRSTLDSPVIPNFAWSNYIGYNIIDTITIKIGDQNIDSHTGIYMYLDYLLNKKKNQENGINIMLGNVPELTTFNNIPKNNYLLYIPLRFWFCKYFNTSLPLISLQHTEVKIIVKLKQLTDVAYWDKIDTRIKYTDTIKSYFLANYICLDSEERTQFATSKHEYLIDTIQHNGTIIHNVDNITDNISRVKLVFSNMCKDLIWIAKFSKNQMNETEMKYNILNWNDFAFNSPKEYIRELQISFNGTYRENWKKYGYYNAVQPYYRGYSSLTDNIFLYSFSLYPQQLQPSGAVNLDKLSDVSLCINISDKAYDMLLNKTHLLQWDIYCHSSNILRIMSGMAGLAFFGSQD